MTMEYYIEEKIITTRLLYVILLLIVSAIRPEVIDNIINFITTLI